LNKPNSKNRNAINIEKDRKLLTFDKTLPFESIGFLSVITEALAEEKISIFVILGYSTDHILVRDKNLTNTKKKLRKL
jgi:hypothetical protein